MDVRELTTTLERRGAVGILRQLWTDREPEEILAWTGEERYHLFGGYLDEELVGVAGVFVADVLHHRRHAWLYDLVVDEPRRGEGHGTALLEFAEEWAAERDCGSLALASPRSMDETHAFYEETGYERWGYVFQREL